MPFYEYVCTACGQPATVLQKLSDPPATDCPACGQAALSKQISAAGFRLKGAGWYETDFKSGGKRNLVEGGDKSADKADKSGDGKSGDKPAAAAATAAATPAASSSGGSSGGSSTTASSSTPGA